MAVQSIRGVGSRKGFSYYAYGVYENVGGRYKLVRSGEWFRSDKRGRRAFPGIPVVKGVRQGTPTNPNAEQSVTAADSPSAVND